MRTDLKVSYGERFEAKRLGARWDAVRKVWFCPDGVDLWPLMKWVEGLTEKERRVLAMIERDCVPDEGSCITPNPDKRDTYYERVDGGPFVRRY